MHKEQLMKLHQFFVYVVKEIINDDFENTNNECKKLLEIYETLDIKPHHIHRLKSEQKAAILLLSACVASYLANNMENVPKNLAKKLEENAFKHLNSCKKNIIILEEDENNGENAEKEERFKRQRERGRPDDKTPEEKEKRELRQYNVPELLQKAEILLDNNGTIEELEKKADKVFKKIESNFVFNE